MFNFINLKEVEELRIHDQKSCVDSAYHWNTLANEEGGEFNKLFVTIASLAIPLSFIPLTNEKIISNLSISDKHLVISSWLLFIFSIISGAIQQYFYFSFHDKLAIREHNRAKIFSRSFVGQSTSFATKEYNKMCLEAQKLAEGPKRANRTFLYIQIVLLFFGVASITYVLSKALLSFPIE